MRFSIWPSPAWRWDEILDLTRHCEATGWDGVYFADHFMPDSPGDTTPLDGDTIECWSVLAGLAAAVPRLRLASLVTSVTYRHPAVLANIAAAVDNMSGGRLTLGLGAGWQANEHAAYGLDLGPVGTRLDRFEEACRVVIGLLRDRRTTFSGRYYDLDDAPNQPAPVQERLPILIGGGGEKRTMRLAAALADEWNTWTTPALLRHKLQVLDRHCEELGRDRAGLAVSTQALVFLSTDRSWLARVRDRDIGRPTVIGTPAEVAEQMAAYAGAGADEFIFPGFNLADPARRRDTVDLFIEEVAPALR
ncbi:MAG TPA: TIGR03560 family F420-dependent LLM class oxidoreductase [Acidimicrobiales bacterium]|nr:TIGR03560 family F420-dependent LLM class oxidoreductase [Acidimicrobiales bacterium]